MATQINESSAGKTKVIDVPTAPKGLIRPPTDAHSKELEALPPDNPITATIYGNK